jgi:putative copper export protein
MEVLFLAGFAIWALWSIGKLGHATKTYVNPRSTQEELESAHGSLGAFWGVLLILVFVFVLAIGGTFTTGLDGDKLRNNAGWVWDGEGSYRK